MNAEEIKENKEILEKVMELCDSLMEDYTMISLRKALEKYQGLSSEKTDEIIRWVAARGFSYCLDPIISHAAVGIDGIISPTNDVCFWGPDQLKSRLYCCI